MTYILRPTGSTLCETLLKLIAFAQCTYAETLILENTLDVKHITLLTY